MQSTNERNPLKTKDTFLLIAECLSPKRIPGLKLVCKDWARWVDEAPWSWEAQEPLKAAKRWRVVLGFPQKGEKYSMLYQLGETRRPSNCTFVCIREIDQAIEIKDLSKEGVGILRAELKPAKGKVVLIRQLNNQRFAIAYDTGEIQIWCLASLKLFFTIPAFNNSISQVANIGINKKRLTRTGVLMSDQEDLLLSANISGELKCWELGRFDDSVKLRWSVQGEIPIKEIQTKEEDNFDIVLCDDVNNIYVVKTLSCTNGEQVGESKKFKRPFRNSDVTLKRVKLYRNGDVLDISMWNSKSSQSICTYTYVGHRNSVNSAIENGFFSHESYGDGKWINSQAYVLEDSFAYMSEVKRAGGEVQIGYPRRLPVTRVEILEDEEVSDTAKKV